MQKSWSNKEFREGLFMKKLMLSIIALLFVLAGCGVQAEQPTPGEEVQHQNGEFELYPIEVEILLSPEHPAVAEEMTVTAVVTQGDEPVNDAAEVVFEYWMHEGDEPFFAEGDLVGDGHYAATIVLEEAGVYFVTAHVTARDMHTMPTEPFMVGDVDREVFEQIVEGFSPSEHHFHHHDDDHDGQGHEQHDEHQEHDEDEDHHDHE
jgi:hypothetical protein